MEQHISKRKAFTLVELIIVITILTILATIAFISFQGYVKNAKDGKRISELNEVRKTIELHLALKPKLPNPDLEKVSAYWQDGSMIFMQGCLGEASKQVLRVLGDASNDSGVCYTYTVNGNKDKYQLTAYLENDPTNIVFHQTYADSIDYTKRFIYTIGTYVVVFPNGAKTPLQKDLDPNITQEDEENGGKKVIFTDTSEAIYDIISTGNKPPVSVSGSQIPETIDDILDTPSSGGEDAGNTPLTNQNSNCFQLDPAIDPDTGDPIPGEYAIIKYKFDEPGCSKTNVTITDTINSQLITEIGDGAFCVEGKWEFEFSCNNYGTYKGTIESVIFNTTSLKKFGEQAFGYNDITHISLPSSLLYPGKLTFVGNPLEEIHMPMNVFDNRQSEGGETFPLSTLKRFYIGNNYFDFTLSDKVVYHLENGTTQDTEEFYIPLYGRNFHKINPTNLNIEKNIETEDDGGKINFDRNTDENYWEVAQLGPGESKFYPLFGPNW